MNQSELYSRGFFSEVQSREVNLSSRLDETQDMHQLNQLIWFHRANPSAKAWPVQLGEAFWWVGKQWEVGPNSLPLPLLTCWVSLDTRQGQGSSEGLFSTQLFVLLSSITLLAAPMPVESLPWLQEGGRTAAAMGCINFSFISLPKLAEVGLQKLNNPLYIFCE